MRWNSHYGAGRSLPLLLLTLAELGNAASSGRLLGSPTDVASEEREAEVVEPSQVDPAEPSGRGNFPVEGQLSRRNFAPNWLEWSVPRECPGVDYIEGRLVDWLGSPPAETDDLAVQAKLRWSEVGWHVRVHVALNGQAGERAVVVESCSDAADFVALTVALSVDPALMGETRKAPEPAPAEPPRRSEREESGKVAEDLLLEEPSKEGEEPAQAAGRPIVLAVGAAAELSAGALPDLHFGLALRLGLHDLLPRTRLWLVGRFLPEKESNGPSARGPIAFSLLSGRLSGCSLLLDGRLSFGPCVLVEVGTIQAGQSFGTLLDQGGSTLWASVGASLELDLRLSEMVRPFAGLDLLVPVANTEFLLNDGSTYYETQVGFRLAGGISFFFEME